MTGDPKRYSKEGVNSHFKIDHCTSVHQLFNFTISISKGYSPRTYQTMTKCSTLLTKVNSSDIVFQIHRQGNRRTIHLSERLSYHRVRRLKFGETGRLTKSSLYRSSNLILKDSIQHHQGILSFVFGGPLT